MHGVNNFLHDVTINGAKFKLIKACSVMSLSIYIHQYFSNFTYRKIHGALVSCSSLKDTRVELSAELSSVKDKNQTAVCPEPILWEIFYTNNINNPQIFNLDFFAIVSNS